MAAKNKNSWKVENGMREITCRSVEMETREDDQKKKHVCGIIPYDSESEDLGGFTEVIRSGAFTKSLQESDVRCLWNHDTSKVIGRKSAQTLTLEDRSDGLHFDAILPNTTWALDMFESITRRDTSGVSFGFQVVKDRWTFDNLTKRDFRELLEVRLFEVSAGVTFPAYPASDCTASTRSLAQEAGVNLDVIGKCIAIRSNRDDYICSESDAAEIRNAIEILKTLLPEESRDRSVTNKPEENSTCESREREIALLEIEAETEE